MIVRDPCHVHADLSQGTSDSSWAVKSAFQSDYDYDSESERELQPPSSKA